MVVHLSYFLNGWIFLIGFILIITAAIIYIRFIRPKFPVTVSCWFCNSQTSVPYGNKNCWDCPECEQYNGFTEDGDYNKPIPSQFDEDLNFPIGCKKDDFLTRGEILCTRCAENQSSKIRQLSNLEPSNEKQFEQELPILKRYMDEHYKLCTACQDKVDQVIKEQDDIIKSRLSDSLLSQLSDHQADRADITVSPFLGTSNKIGIAMSYCFHAVEVVNSLGLVLRQIQLDTDKTGVIQAYFPGISKLFPVLATLDRYLWHLLVTLIMSGLLAKVCVTNDRIFKIDLLNGVFLLLVLLTQSDLLVVLGTGTVLETTVFMGCFITSLLCLLTKRREYNPVYVLKSRRQNSSFLSDSVSICNSSVYQPANFTHPVSEYQVNNRSQSRENSFSDRQYKQDNQGVNISYTVFKMESFNLGCEEPGLGPKTRSRSNSISSQLSSRSSYAGALSSQEVPSLRQRKCNSPLIVPSRFSSTSNTQGQTSTFPGLFQQTFLDFRAQTHTTSSPQVSTQNSMFSQNIETPSIMVTKFGATPYTVPTVFGGRQKSGVWTSDMNNGRSVLHRSNSFKCLRDVTRFDEDADETADDISHSDGENPDNDSDMDCVSDFTSVSHQHLVSMASTVTMTTTKSNNNFRYRFYPWVLAFLCFSVIVGIFPVNLPILSH